jgi:hypothetical protein
MQRKNLTVRFKGGGVFGRDFNILEYPGKQNATVGPCRNMPTDPVSDAARAISLPVAATMSETIK